MATTKTNKSAFTSNVLRDSYTLVQSFTTGGTAQALQTTPITPTALAALSGVFAMGSGDAARLIFYATSGTTSPTLLVSSFEPIADVNGVVQAYQEIPVTSITPVALTLGSTVTAGATLAATYATIPSTAPSIITIADLVSGRYGLGSGGTTDDIQMFSIANGGTAYLDFKNGAGATHIRVMLSCATAAKTLFCLGRRVAGASKPTNS